MARLTSEKPWRNRGHVGLSLQRRQILLIRSSHRNATISVRGPVVAIARPRLPAECTVDGVEIALAWPEVRYKEDRTIGTSLECTDIETVAREGGGEDLTVDHKLTRQVGIPSNHLPDLESDASAIPVEVKGDKDLRSFINSAIVGKIK
jgi:hypothetical protein